MNAYQRVVSFMLSIAFTMLFITIPSNAGDSYYETMNIGDTMTLNFSNTPAGQRSITSTSWTSSRPWDVVITSQAGRMCWIRADNSFSGYAVVQCYYAYVSGSYTAHDYVDYYIAVNPKSPTGISVTPISKTVDIGDTFTLSASLTPSNSQSSLYWSSSNTSVATVSNGKVTAVDAGTANITVRTDNNLTASSYVTVLQPDFVVRETAPAHNEDNISVNAIPSITYSLTISPSAQYSNISLKNKTTQESLPGTSSINGKTLSFTPEFALIPNTVYQLTVPSNAVQNKYGTNYTEATEIDFTTEVLSVINSTPANNADTVALDQVISVNFSESIQEGPNFDNIAIIEEDTGVSLPADINTNGSVLSITPARPGFKYLTKYCVIIPDNAISNSDGIPHRRGEMLKFLTVDSPLALMSTQPLNNEDKVSRYARIINTFNGNIREGENYNDISLVKAEGMVLIPGEARIIDDSLHFLPKEPLENNTHYIFTIPERAIEGIYSNPNTSEYIQSFTTIPKAKAPNTQPADEFIPTGKEISLTSDTAGAEIYYTTDGSEPTTESTLYEQPIIASGIRLLLKAIAVCDGYEDSDILISEFFTVNEKTPPPKANPAGGFIDADTYISLYTEADDALIYYTTDGTEPTTSDTLYTSPFPAGNPNITVKAIAVSTGLLASDTAVYMYSPLSVVPSKIIIFGGSGNDVFNQLKKTDTGFVAVGYSNAASFGTGDWIGVSSKGGVRDAIIVKFDDEGSVVWQKSFGGGGDDYFTDVAVDNDGFVAVGNSDKFGAGDWAGFSGSNSNSIIVKFDNDGNVVWKNRFSGDSNTFYGVTADSDGYVAVGSHSSRLSSNLGFNNVVKYNRNGERVWSTKINGSSGIGGSAWAITLSGTNYIVLGNYSSSQSAGAYISKLNSSGSSFSWKKNFSGSVNFRRITPANGGYAAVGNVIMPATGTGDWTGFSKKGSQDSFILKLNDSGNIIWKSTFGGGGGTVYFEDVVSCEDGGYIATGYTEGRAYGDNDLADMTPIGKSSISYDALLIKYDENGKILWKKNFGGCGNGGFTGTRFFGAILTDSGYVMGGALDAGFDSGDFLGVVQKGGSDAILVFFDKETIGTPTSNIVSHDVNRGELIKLRTNIDGATIYYTTDNSIPTENSRVYDKDIMLLDNTIIKAISVSNGVPSSAAVFKYRVGEELALISAPELLSKSAVQVTLNPIENAEFSIDNGATWQSSSIFSGLEPDCEYSFITRLAGYDEYEPSTASPPLKVTTNKPTLIGVASIIGECVCGETLTVHLDGISSEPEINDYGELSYQWTRDGRPIAIGESYTLALEDVGKTFIVKVSASNCEGVIESEATEAVTDGALIKGIEWSGDVLTVTLDRGLLSDEALIVAFYDNNGKKLRSIELAPPTELGKTIITFRADINADTVKVMMMDSLNNIRPLCKARGG